MMDVVVKKGRWRDGGKFRGRLEEDGEADDGGMTTERQEKMED